jgi:hypothetical protein
MLAGVSREVHRKGLAMVFDRESVDATVGSETCDHYGVVFLSAHKRAGTGRRVSRQTGELVNLQEKTRLSNVIAPGEDSQPRG